MKVLVVEDNPGIVRFLERGLREEGYAVTAVGDGNEGYDRARGESFDAAIIDVMLPGRSGMEIVRALRREGSDLPVLLLTARDAIDDKVEGLDAGADDYLTKPFDFGELLARVRALLRRSAGSTPATLAAGGVALDPVAHLVTLDGQPVELTPREFSLLEYLLRNRGRALSRSTLMEHVWGIRFDPGTNVVDVFINGLRRKLDPDRRLIRTVRGVGYMIREEPDDSGDGDGHGDGDGRADGGGRTAGGDGNDG